MQRRSIPSRAVPLLAIALLAATVVAVICVGQFASASQLGVTSKQVAAYQLTTRPSVPKVLRVVASEDTWNDDRATTTTHGNDPRLGIADSSQACFVIASASCTTIRNARAYVKFDLSALPAGATVQSATIELEGGPTTIGASVVTARRVTSSWSESTMTYNSRPGNTSTGAVTAAVTNVSGTMVATFNVTSFVQNRATTSITNGFELRPNGADSWWYSSEWAAASLRPTLTVIYQ
jgi:hypothetical protein